MAPGSAQLAGTSLAAVVAVALLVSSIRSQASRRSRKVTPAEERVLVLGASSGVGHAIAKQYAARGARVCVVARRAEQVSALAKECGDKCIGQAADFSKAEDMVRVRELLLSQWGGLDTIHICAGVSALRPVLALAGVEQPGEDASDAAIQGAVDIAGKAIQGNFTGPFVSALTFVSCSLLSGRNGCNASGCGY